MKTRVEYIKSAVNAEDWPQDDRLEIAITGRSNSGKSTFINAITGSKIAKVSSTPGKTITLNFFNFGRFYRYVDMPGYGYASRSSSALIDWSKMIEPFMIEREGLCGVILMMDVRRQWSRDEELLKKFLQHHGLPLAIVLSKKDKLNQKELSAALKEIKKAVPEAAVYVYSSLKKDEASLVEAQLFEAWIKPKLEPEILISSDSVRVP